MIQTCNNEQKICENIENFASTFQLLFLALKQMYMYMFMNVSSAYVRLGIMTIWVLPTYAYI